MGIVFIAFSLGYPFLVYWGLTTFSPRKLALIVGGFFLCGLIRRRPIRSFLPLTLAIAAIVFLEMWFNHGTLFLFVPALVNGSLLMAFGATLFKPPSMVETFARMQVAVLSSEEIKYCWRVTFTWCLFFVMNLTVSLGLALFGSLEHWTFYNGFLSYVLMGTLFTAELIFRNWRFRRYEGAATDFIFRKIFPPSSTQRSNL